MPDYEKYESVLLYLIVVDKNESVCVSPFKFVFLSYPSFFAAFLQSMLVTQVSQGTTPSFLNPNTFAGWVGKVRKTISPEGGRKGGWRKKARLQTILFDNAYLWIKHTEIIGFLSYIVDWIPDLNLLRGLWNIQDTYNLFDSLHSGATYLPLWLVWVFTVYHAWLQEILKCDCVSEFLRRTNLCFYNKFCFSFLSFILSCFSPSLTHCFMSLSLSPFKIFPLQVHYVVLILSIPLFSCFFHVSLHVISPTLKTSLPSAVCFLFLLFSCLSIFPLCFSIHFHPSYGILVITTVIIHITPYHPLPLTKWPTLKTS